MPLIVQQSLPVTLSDLSDVSIVAPQTAQYLRYNSSNSLWQNSLLNTDVFNYLTTSLTGSNGITLTSLSGSQTFDLSLTAVNSAIGTFGSSTVVPVVTVDAYGRVTSVTDVPISTTSGDVTSALGYTPYDASNPDGYTTNTGTVTSVAGTGTVSGLTLSGEVTISGNLVLAGTLSLTNSNVTTGLGYTPVNASGDTLSGTLTFSSGTVTGIATPVAASDAATKSYVDSLITGLSWKTSVKVATTVNVVLSGLQTIDGVIPLAGDRILVKNQTDTTTNGIYTMSAGVWPRASDADTASEIDGSAVYVLQGTTQADTGWTETSLVTALGTDNITYAQFSGTATYAAGTGLSLTGNTFANTGVTSIVAGTNISVSASTGVVTISASGSVPTATSASNITGGATGSLPYQTAASTTTMLSAGTASQVLISGSSPSWTNSPAISGTNFTVIPNSALTNSSITVTAGSGMSGGGSVSLGGTVTLTNAGVTSAVAGTNISVSGGTGAVTISTSSTPSFSTITSTALTTGATATAGTITGAWTLTAGSKLQSTYADLAEWYLADAEYDPGTVLVFGGTSEVTTTDTVNDTRVAGVVTTDPAYVMNARLTGICACIALQGRIPVKVTGKCKKGDLLTTSTVPGYAIRAALPTLGSIIGKSLEDKNTDDASVIQVAIGRH